MENVEVVIIGGGAAGLTAALALNKKTIVLERGERVGRKLSATGNGQGNVGNLDINESRYFTFGERRLISSCMQKFPQTEILAFFENSALCSARMKEADFIPPRNRRRLLPTLFAIALKRTKTKG